MRRWILGLAAFLVLGSGVGVWFRPYGGWSSEGKSVALRRVEVIRDRSFRWLNITVKLDGRTPLSVPIALELADGRRLEPHELAPLGGKPGQDIATPRALKLRFWLDASDLRGPLLLRVGEDSLTIRHPGPSPTLAERSSRRYLNSHW